MSQNIDIDRKSRQQRYEALGLDSTRDYFSAQGLKIPLHAFEQFKLRHRAEPQEAFELLKISVPTAGRSINAKHFYPTVQRLSYQASSRTFIRILIDDDSKAITTVLAPKMRTEPELEETWRPARWSALCASINDPADRGWHYPELAPTYDAGKCSSLRAHTLSKENGEIVKTDLGLVPIELSPEMPDVLDLPEDHLARCLERLAQHRLAKARSADGVLTLELRLWGVRKVRVSLQGTGYSDTYEMLGREYDHSFAPKMELTEVAA